MSKANLSKHLTETAKGVLADSEVYLHLYHGDTSSHPYVTDFHAAARAEAPAKVSEPVFVSTDTPDRAPVTPQVGWHGQYCLKKFGRTTPGRAPE